MSEWLGKSKITEEDIKSTIPSLAKYFPMITQYFVDNQKIRLIVSIPYEWREDFVKAVTKKFGSFTASNVKRATMEAVEKWIKENV